MEYLNYLLIGIPFFMLGSGLPPIIRCDGNPKYAMLATLSGCILNVILDPIMIFVLHLGIKGAAIATVIGQVVSGVLCAYYLFHAQSFKLKSEDFVLNSKILKKCLPLGISSFLTQISIMINLTVMNNVIVHYGNLSKYAAVIPLSVAGIVQKVFGIIIAIVVGVAAGSQPIIGYNYGAKRYDRVKKLYKYIMIAEVCTGIISSIIFECFPLQVIHLFGSEGALYNEYAVMAFRIYFSTTTLCCVLKGTSIFMQALGKPIMSMGLALLRDFILCVPLIVILPIKFGIVGPLLSAPISDIVSFIAVIGVMVYLKKMLSTH